MRKMYGFAEAAERDCSDAKMRGPRRDLCRSSDDFPLASDSSAQALAAFAISQVHHGPRF